jgi:hypothetical protein
MIASAGAVDAEAEAVPLPRCPGRFLHKKLCQKEKWERQIGGGKGSRGRHGKPEHVSGGLRSSKLLQLLNVTAVHGSTIFLFEYVDQFPCRHGLYMHVPPECPLSTTPFFFGQR